MIRLIAFFLLLLPFQSLLSKEKEWEIAIDSTANLSVNQILSGDYFHFKDTNKIKTFGFTSSAIWMKTSLEMPQGGSVIIDNPMIRYVDFFLLKDDSILQHREFEYLQDRLTNESELSILKFEIPQEFEGEVLFRFASAESLFIQIDILDKEEEAVFLASSKIIEYLSIGAVLALGILYLVFFISLQDRIYLLYSLYSITGIIQVLRLNGLLLVWFPFMNVFNDYTSVFGTMPSLIIGIFTIQFLQLKRYSKVMLWVVRTMVVMQLLSLAISFSGYNSIAIILTDLIAFLFIPTALGLSIWLWFEKGYKPAKYYLLSFIFLFAGAIILLLRNYSIISSDSIIINHSLDLGIALEMIFLAVGLSKKIDTLRIEKNKLQAENILILNQKKSELEYLVHERTKMLEAQNEEIIQQQEEIAAINDSLERTVKKRTLQLRLQNEKLLDYAYFNAHKVRGPLARILGLVYLIKKSNTEDTIEMINRIDSSAQELDEVIKQVNSSLTDKAMNDRFEDTVD